MNNIKLNKQLTYFWELEDAAANFMKPREYSYCENLNKITTFRISSGKFVASIPNAISLGQSGAIAILQFDRNKSRLLNYDRV